jgi:phage terminase large subunit-like protein
MILEAIRRLFEWLRKATAKQVEAFVSKLSASDLAELDPLYEMWAHDAQLPPATGWRVWLMLAGRGFGKTRAGAEWINGVAKSRRGVRIALVGATIADARAVMVEGVSGILNVARRRRERVRWEPSLGRLRWANGSEAQLFSGDNADGLRGPEHDFAWCDELAKWRDAEAAWDNLQFGLRRGRRARALVTTTPRPLPLIKRIMGDEWTVTTRGRTGDNINLDEKTIEVLTATYGGTRIGAQELDGELLEDVEGALWTREVIERSRVLFPLPARSGAGVGASEANLALSSIQPASSRPEAYPPPTPPLQGGEFGFDRIVVGVDPPAGASENSDACGIMVCGSAGGALFVLEDATVRGLSPEGWASRVAAAAARWNTGWSSPRRTTAGRWSRACSRPPIWGCGCGWCMRLGASARGLSRSRSSSRRGRRSSPASFRSLRPSSAGWSQAAAMRGLEGRPIAPTRWCGR